MAGTLKTSVVLGAALGKSFSPTFRSADARVKSLGKTLRKLRMGRALSGDVLDLRKRLSELRRQQLRTGGGSRELAREIRSLESRLTEATQKAERHGVQVGQVAREHERLGRSVRDAEAQLGRLQRREQRRRRRQELRGRALPLIGGAYAAGRAIGSSLEVEERAVRLSTVINVEDGDVGAAVARARTQARDFARRSLASETEILDIQYALNSAGLSESAARAASEVVSKVATVTQGLPEQVGEIIGTTFNNMGDAISGASVEEKLQRIGDVLTRVQLKYQIRDFNQLGESMKSSSASAVAQRLPLEQAATALGLLNSAGLQGSEAGTALNAVLRQMGKAARELGTEIVRDAQGNLDFVATLDGIRQALSSVGDLDARNQVIQDLFGDEGMKGLVPLLDRYRSGLDDFAASTGVVDEKYRIFLESAPGQWKMFRQNLGLISNLLAGSVLPHFNAVINQVGIFAGWVAGLIQRFPILGQSIAVAGTALGTFFAGAWVLRYVKTLIGDTVDTFRSLKGPIKTLGAAFLRLGRVIVGVAVRVFPLLVGGVKAIGAALVANPIGAIIAGIAGAALLIYIYWEPITTFFSNLWEGVGNAFNSAWTSIKSLFSGFSLIESGRRLVATLIEGIKSAPGAVWSAVKDMLGGVGRLLPESDAAEGPLSRLSASGSAILGTLGQGLQRSRLDALRRPLARALTAATAGLALTVPLTLEAGTAPDTARPSPLRPSPSPLSFDIRPSAASPPAENPVPTVIQYHNRITIHQQPGEDAAALADRIVRAIERRGQRHRRTAAHDGF